MSKDYQAISKEGLYILRKMAYLLVEVSLSTIGVFVATMLMHYCFNAFHYIAKEGGYYIVALWMISMVSIVWITFMNLVLKIWTVFGVQKYKITFFSSLPKSFATGFSFTILYVFLCEIVEMMPNYAFIERFFWVIVFFGLPVLCVIMMWLFFYVQGYIKKRITGLL